MGTPPGRGETGPTLGGGCHGWADVGGGCSGGPGKAAVEDHGMADGPERAAGSGGCGGP